MFLWIGLGASPEFMQKVFDAPSAIQADIERVDLPKLDNPLSLAIRSIIEEIRYQRHRCMRVRFIRHIIIEFNNNNNNIWFTFTRGV